MVGCITCYGLFIVVVGCITHLPKKSKQSSVKRKSLNDVGQQSLEKVQAGTHILHQAMKGNDVVVGIHKSKQQENGIQNQILMIKLCLCKSFLFIWFSLIDYFYVLCYFSIICYTCYIFIQTFVLLCVLRFLQEHKSLCGADMPTSRMEFACSASCSRDNM